MSKLWRIILLFLILATIGFWGYLLYSEFLELPRGSESYPFMLYNLKVLLFAVFIIASVTILMYVAMFAVKEVSSRSEAEGASLDDPAQRNITHQNNNIMADLKDIRTLLISKLGMIDRIWDSFSNTDIYTQLKDQMSEESLMKMMSLQTQLLNIKNIGNLFNHLVETACSMTDAQRVSLFLYNPEKKNLVMVKSKGFEHQMKIEINIGDGIAGYAFQQGKRLFVTNIESHPQLGRKNLPQYKTKSFIVFPIGLFFDDNSIGVLNLTEKSTEGGIFSILDLEKINFLINNFRLKMENLILIREWNKSEGDKIEKNN